MCMDTAAPLPFAQDGFFLDAVPRFPDSLPPPSSLRFASSLLCFQGQTDSLHAAEGGRSITEWELLCLFSDRQITDQNTHKLVDKMNIYVILIMWKN